MDKHYELYKKVVTNGCVFEDGSDTRKTETQFILVSEDQEDEFGEEIADDCGSQDYSYQVHYIKLMDLWHDELIGLKQFFDNLKYNEM